MSEEAYRRGYRDGWKDAKEDLKKDNPYGPYLPGIPNQHPELKCLVCGMSGPMGYVCYNSNCPGRVVFLNTNNTCDN